MVAAHSNVNQFDGHLAERGSSVLELETRYSLFNQPGKLRLIGFLNRTNSGSYRETLGQPRARPRHRADPHGRARNTAMSSTSSRR